MQTLRKEVSRRGWFYSGKWQRPKSERNDHPSGGVRDLKVEVEVEVT
jgi:hypothetical protein